MSLTEKQIEEYRKKLRDGEYMETAINGIAEKLSAWCTMVKLPCKAEPAYAEPEINNTEEKEMKNKPIDLNNHLFEQIERLNDDDLKGEDLDRECKRTQQMCNVATQIINNRNSVTDALKVLDKFPDVSKSVLLLE
jgi:hypothetical protein